MGTNDTIRCKLDINGASRPSVVRAVTDGSDVHVFGYDADFNDFCCVLTPSNADDTIVSITGSTYGDAVHLWYDSSSSAYDLEPAFTTVDMHATILGANGNDVIRGSRYDDPSYVEWLQGGDGADTLVGQEGDDFLFGGNGDDTLYGNEGDAGGILTDCEYTITVDPGCW